MGAITRHIARIRGAMQGRSRAVCGLRGWLSPAAALALLVTLTGCDIDAMPGRCDYNVELYYHYNQENTSAENQFERYIKSAEQYIFDASGVLCSISPVEADPCTGEWKIKAMLPPGRYTVIAVGNRTSMSRTHDQLLGNLQIGRTRREDMLLTLTNRSADGTDDGVHYQSTGRLFHGYRTFSVQGTGISRVRVDMVHSHLDLRYTIRWKNNKAPGNTNDFYVRLSDLPSEYGLMPEYVYPEIGTCENYDCPAHDQYMPVSLAVRHHIPHVKYDVNSVSHRQEARLRGNTISGQTITYRIRNCGADIPETTISLWRSNAASTGVPDQLMKDIHLNDFLNRNSIDLDHTLKQQYHIIFEIDPDTGQVRAWFADIADWDEGGNLGG